MLKRRGVFWILSLASVLAAHATASCSSGEHHAPDASGDVVDKLDTLGPITLDDVVIAVDLVRSDHPNLDPSSVEFRRALFEALRVRSSGLRPQSQRPQPHLRIQSEYLNGGILTPAERLLVFFHPVNAFITQQASEDATNKALELFPDDTIQRTTRGDAFRHAYWSILLAKRVDITWSEDFTTAHEEKADEPDDETGMDLHNNAVGRLVFFGNQTASESRLAEIAFGRTYRRVNGLSEMGGNDIVYLCDLCSRQDRAGGEAPICTSFIPECNCASACEAGTTRCSDDRNEQTCGDVDGQACPAWEDEKACEFGCDLRSERCADPDIGDAGAPGMDDGAGGSAGHAGSGTGGSSASGEHGGSSGSSGKGGTSGGAAGRGGTTGGTGSSDACANVSCADDGNVCNGVEHCESGSCVSGPALTCGSNQQCYPSSGCGCINATVESAGCENCGTKTRACTNSSWSAWSPCTGQGACSPGTSQSCGGSATQVCTSSCAWGGCVGCGNSACDGGENCRTCAQDCPCPGGACDLNISACVGCGGQSEACCQGNSCDNGSLVCFGGSCTHCGLLGEPCCAMSPDCSSGVCTDGFCQPPQPVIFWSTDFEGITWEHVGGGILPNGIELTDAGGPLLATQMGTGYLNGSFGGQALAWRGGGSGASRTDAATMILPAVLDVARAVEVNFDAFNARTASFDVAVSRSGCSTVTRTVSSSAWSSYSVSLPACGFTSRVVFQVGAVYQFSSDAQVLRIDNVTVAYP